MSLRIAIKCSWSGARYTVPPTTTVTPKTTLLEIIQTIQSSLPPSIFENGELLYIRKCINASDWQTTTLKSLGIDLKKDAGAGVLFTLNEASSAPTPPPPTTAAAEIEPMEVDDNNSTSKALELLLASNFDADSKECIITLCKLLDNVIAKPGNEKVRTIRLTNEAIHNKVASKRGGVEFLLACGFTYKTPTTPLLSPPTTPPPKPDFIELLPQNESTSTLLSARKLLSQKAIQELNMKSSDLPKMKSPPPPPPTVSSSSSGNNRNSNSFNPYKTQSYNTQSAAVGAPNPTQIGGNGSGGISTTEKKLNALKSKQERLEKKMQIIENRGLVATKPGENVGPIVSLESGSDGGGTGGTGGKSDGALLAARMKRMEEERKKREEGGFTTKAMRDLEKMKKQKVYSHTQLRINFSDGCSLHSKFLPSEKVSTVKEVITSAFCVEFQSVLKFDLYVAPPRRMLDVGKKLDEEGLVPAAKVHVSWKMDGAPPPSSVGSYIRPELFQSSSANTAAAASYPDAKNIVEEDKKNSAKKRAAGDAASSASSGDTKVSREEAMMQRMMGMKPKGLLGKTSSKGASKSSGGGGGGKPKWFKG